MATAFVSTLFFTGPRFGWCGVPLNGINRAIDAVDERIWNVLGYVLIGMIMWWLYTAHEKADNPQPTPVKKSRYLLPWSGCVWRMARHQRTIRTLPTAARQSFQHRIRLEWRRITAPATAESFL